MRVSSPLLSEVCRAVSPDLYRASHNRLRPRRDIARGLVHVASSVSLCLIPPPCYAVIRNALPFIVPEHVQQRAPHELPSPSFESEVSCVACPFPWSFSACARSSSIFASIAASWLSSADAVCSPLASSWKAWHCQLDVQRVGVCDGLTLAKSAASEPLALALASGLSDDMLSIWQWLSQGRRRLGNVVVRPRVSSVVGWCSLPLAAPQEITDRTSTMLW